MDVSPYLARIIIYPIKSLDGIEIKSARVLPGGALESDRRFSLRSADGRFVNGKREAKIHQIRAEYSDDGKTVTLGFPDGSSETFPLVSGPSSLTERLGTFLGYPVTIDEHIDGGFPDDTASPGPTVITTATLEAVATWFGLTVESVRRRFRANLEIGGVPAFWEDQLYGPEGTTVRFTIDNVTFEGVNPCQRCVVPSRDPNTGGRLTGFAATFARHREESLPKWVERTRFDHFFRLAVNTRITSESSVIRIGEPIATDMLNHE